MLNSLPDCAAVKVPTNSLQCQEPAARAGLTLLSRHASQGLNGSPLTAHPSLPNKANSSSQQHSASGHAVLDLLVDSTQELHVGLPCLGVILHQGHLELCHLQDKYDNDSAALSAYWMTTGLHTPLEPNVLDDHRPPYPTGAQRRMGWLETKTGAHNVAWAGIQMQCCMP